MSLPRYPEYRNSGVEWIGKIPGHWKLTRLKHVLSEMGSGGTPDTSNSEFWIDAGGTPWVAIADMSSVDRVKVTAKELSEQGVESKRLTIWPAGTLIFSMYASLGHVAELSVPAAINQALLALVPREPGCQRFLRYWLVGIRPQLRAEASSNTQDNLNAEKVANLVCLVPSAQEQADIANFLDRETAKIDALIAEQERLLALLAEKRKATISHTVTRGLDPDAPMRDSGIPWLGEVPVHWECVRLGAIYREVSEPGGDDLPVLSVSIHDGVSDRELGDSELDRKVTRSEDRSKYKRVLPNDLTYNMMRAWQGAFGTVRVAGQVSPAYVVARPKAELLTAFVEYLLRTPQAIEQVRRYSRGITEFRLRLYWAEFKNLQVPLPPVREQAAILSSVAAETAKYESTAKEIEMGIALLKARRSALITAAVTGQIDIRDAVGAQAA